MATLMAPGLGQIGTYERGRRVCMDISVGGGRQFAGDTLFTYPGNGRNGPGGPVTLRVVDPAAHPKIRPYVAPGVFFLIPVSPLRSRARYTVTVTVAGTKDTLSKTWRFTTA